MHVNKLLTFINYNQVIQGLNQPMEDVDNDL